MVDVAVEGGGINGDTYGVEGRSGDVLEVATEVGSGVVAVSPSLLGHCFALLLSQLTYFQFSSNYIPYSNYRRPQPMLKGVPIGGKKIAAVVLRMYLV